ncbi:hypothetical protein HGRIS_013445 [Hohenbuehelia grisea]|uniref:Uncharacterized protein n=1 Tax=Hohenbuehelia grisea TaxID=104357 RepID=A0ABR3IVG6_9AGAR
MRPSVARLVRIIPRSSVQASEITIVRRPEPQTLELEKPTLIDVFMKRQEEAGSNWPMNLRIEPVVKKQALHRVKADARTQLKELLRER